MTILTTILTMKAMGYRVNFDPRHKYWTIQGEGWKRPKRLYRLGEDYTNELIVERISENSYAVKFSKFAPAQKQVKVFLLKGSLKRTKKIGGLRGLYLHYCYKLGIFPKRKKQNPVPLHYLLKDDLLKMEYIAQETRLLCRHHIDTAEKLEKKPEKKRGADFFPRKRRKPRRSKPSSERQGLFDEGASKRPSVKKELKDIQKRCRKEARRNGQRGRQQSNRRRANNPVPVPQKKTKTKIKGAR